VRFAIVADDLTGAADSGVQLVRAGYRTAVVFRGESAPEDLDAAVLDTDSRSLPAEEARERVLSAGEALATAGIAYKKIDSTLRGGIVAELRAALEASGREKGVVAPAFPDAGRTTLGGVQLLHGEPVHETELSRDPRNPVSESHLPTLLRDLGPVENLRSEALTQPSVREALARAGWLVADAASNGDLDSLVRAVPDPGEVLWAGSAGLAAALGRLFPGSRKEPPSRPSGAKRVLLVVGSASGVSRKQLRRVSKSAKLVELSPEAPSEASEALGAGRNVALHAPEASTGDPESVVEGLSEVVFRLSEEGLFDALVLTGGETAVRVSKRLGASGILLADELEPGVPVGVLSGSRPYPVVTKAGAFGGPDALLDALRTLSDEPGEEPT
jgi:D-threonate/D-erythronate kinase